MNYSATFQRYKVMPIIRSQLSDINKKVGSNFEFKFKEHFIDRIIQRNIDINRVIKLIDEIVSDDQNINAINNYLRMPEMPIDGDIDPNVEYRPTRLEFSDGVLWIGLTPYQNKYGNYQLYLRMAIINKSRLSVKISKTLLVTDEYYKHHKDLNH